MFQVVQIKAAFVVDELEVCLTFTALNQVQTLDTVVLTLLAGLSVAVIKLTCFTRSTCSDDSIRVFDTVTLAVDNRLVDWTVGRLAGFGGGVEVMCLGALVA